MRMQAALVALEAPVRRDWEKARLVLEVALN